MSKKKVRYDDDELACADELATVDGARRCLGSSMAAARKVDDRGLEWIRVNTGISNTANSLMRTELLQNNSGAAAK